MIYSFCTNIYRAHLDNGEKGFGVILWALQNVIYKKELEDAWGDCLKNYG